MLKRVLAVIGLLSIVGCSSLSLETLPGPMDRIGNERYGYRFLIPSKWDFDVNSNIRPTKLEVRDAKADAAIIVTVMEGREPQEMTSFIKELGKQKKAESFTLIRNWRTSFDDNTGYVVNFIWKGKLRLDKKEYGKPGVEYQGSAAMVERNPSPILFVSYAPKVRYKEMNDEFFVNSRHSLKVKPVELTVRKVEEED